jgi:hypothetical protein
LLAGAVDATSGTGAIGMLRTVAKDEGVQAMGKAVLHSVLDGEPALMSALEVLAEVHPFTKGILL